MLLSQSPGAFKDAADFDTGCPECGGTGWVEVTDWVDYGSTVVSMPSVEPCEACVGQGNCPKCGAPWDSPDGDTGQCQNGHALDDDGNWT